MDNVDLYAILDLDKTCSENQIKASYRKLALKYHPDRNRGNVEAGEKFKQVSQAYSVLMDPNKRRQYDLSGPNGVDMEFESFDVEQMGGLGRMFGALLSKIGMPIPTQIAQSTLSNARDISDGNGDGIVVRNMELGMEYVSKVDKQESHFYKLALDSADKGVLVTCRSASKSKFKLVLFDDSGSVKYVQESTKKNKCTAADLLFTTFEILDLGVQFMPVDLDSEVPPLFSKIAMLQAKRLNIEKGEHLFCVYGDNWLSSVKYSLTAMIPETEDPSVATIQSTEAALIAKKDTLTTFHDEYTAAKTAFENATKQLEQHNQETEQLFTTREAAYEAWFSASEAKYTQEISPADSEPGMFSIFSGLSSKFSSKPVDGSPKVRERPRTQL